MYELVEVAIEYDYQRGTMIFNQAGAICRYHRKYGIEQCKAISTTMENNASELLRKEAETIYDIPFRDAIGCLLYTEICTRPDILFAVGTL